MLSCIGGVKVDSFIYSPLLSSSVQGTDYTGIMHVTDWFPTMLELADISYIPTHGYYLDGVSQVIVNATSHYICSHLPARDVDPCFLLFSLDLDYLGRCMVDEHFSPRHCALQLVL
jgi:hypothetical protein